MPLNRVTVYRRRPDNVVHVGCLLATLAITAAPARTRVSSTRGRSNSKGWQRAITHEHAELLVRGLIDSDGCRFLNRVRHGEKVYVYPRYMFSNRSRRSTAIFTEHLDLLGDRVALVERPHDLGRAPRIRGPYDEFVGPKR